MDVEATSGTVLLLKAPKDHEDPYVNVLQTSGYTASCLPVLSFIFGQMEELWAAVERPEAHSGVIFTSQRAVEAVTQCITNKNKLKEWEQRVSTVWKEKYCFCVGKATGKEARNLGFLPHGEDSGSADGLVLEIIKIIPPCSLPLLFPCGNLRRETIPQALSKAGVSLEAVTCYQTGPDPNIRRRLEGFIEKKGVPEYVVFFSPSGVDFTKPHLEDLQLVGHKGRTKWVAIGSTTRQALEKAGLVVTAEALSPTPEGLLEALSQVRMVPSS